MKKASAIVSCYACGSKNAWPRDIEGTLYYLCDDCFDQHIWANLMVLDYLMTKRDSCKDCKPSSCVRCSKHYSRSSSVV